MASGPFIIPNKAALNIFNATDLLALTANWKLKLVGSGWTPDNSDSGNEVIADVSSEIANGNGYTTGGIALTSVALSMSGGVIKFTCAPATWNATGSGIPAWRRAVLYNTATVNGKVAPILGHFLGDASGIDVPLTASGIPLAVTMHASGIVTGNF